MTSDFLLLYYYLEATGKCYSFFFIVCSIYITARNKRHNELFPAFSFIVYYNKRFATMMKQARGRQTKDVGYHEQCLL